MLKYFIEIKNRFILLIINLLTTLLTCYFYKEILLFLITRFYLNSINFYFIFTDITELFSVYIQLITFISFQICFIYFFYQIYMFVSPALFCQELVFITFFLKLSSFFFIIAIFFFNCILIPLSWNFFLSFQSSMFYFEAKLNNYLEFYKNIYFLSISYCQSFTLLFFFFIDINSKLLYIKKFRKLYYYIFLLLATLISPPDILSQICISFILTCIYEFLLFVFFFRTFIISNAEL